MAFVDLFGAGVATAVVPVDPGFALLGLLIAFAVSIAGISLAHAAPRHA